MDVLNPRQRSHCMSQIRGRDTKPEIILRKALWSAGLRYRLHHQVTGKPDVAFPRSRVAVFCDGCFWHGCPVHSVSPKTNSSFWKTKIEKNRTRDERVTAMLRDEGWTVIRFWEHDIKSHPVKLAGHVKRVLRKVTRRGREP
ncbi:very short patch repair endonuclease [Taklimakanibacter lacteus]|uniref:very short patch repair endonuclease n=1 Tax=Taklimakanibacter lacteus TaxID=2268456 RepID=UPI000E666B53